MRAFFLLSLLLIPSFLFAKEPSPVDNSGGAQAHASVSFAIGVATDLGELKPLPAFSSCMAIGVLKETYDYFKPSPGLRHGLFSKRDLLADAGGCLLGYFSAEGVRWAFSSPRRGSAYLAFSAAF
jgi:hypothetical protein